MLSKRFRLKPLNLRQRLLLTALLWIGGLIFAAGITVPTIVNNYLVDNAKSQLHNVINEISSSLTFDDQGTPTLQQNVSDPRFNQPYSGHYWAVSVEDKTLLSNSLLNIGFKTKNRFFQTIVGPNNEKLITVHRRVTIPKYDVTLDITVGIDEDPIEDAVIDLTEWLMTILLTLFAGLMGLIFLQISWSLKPLSKLQKELKALDSGTKEKLSAHYPEEIKPLISDLNSLLFHYSELLERARNHAGNLSHSLKTPLSVLKNQVSELPSKHRDELSTTVVQLQERIDYHLSRVRVAGAINILSVKSNPSERVEAMTKAFDKIYVDKNLILSNELADDLFVAVEVTDLDEMLGNLIENSYKWGQSLIRIHAVIESTQVKLIVEDDGDGINHDKLNEIVKRGIRLDETMPGTGLGLNIVAEMAHSYRGTLDFDHSPMGGLKATLTLNLSR